MINFGMCFSKSFDEDNPLNHIGKKRATYLELFSLCQSEGWNVYAVTKRTYKGEGVFDGVWAFKNGKFEKEFKQVKMNLVFDWTNGLGFPLKNDQLLSVVDSRPFKSLCSDKWKMYKELKDYMPPTFYIPGPEINLKDVLAKIKTDWVVLKPCYGLKGKGVFVGPKSEAIDFKLKGRYVAQEFLDTSGGIEGITNGRHDLRIVVTNKKVVWCHVRTPKEGDFKANVGQGGSLTEVDYKLVPESVKRIVSEVSVVFYKKYDNPLFSIDFGIQKGKPYIFEINDQIGFPLPDAKGKDNFLKELVENFKSKM